MRGFDAMLYEFVLLVKHSPVRGRALKHWTLWALATAFGWSLAAYAGLPIGRVVLAEGGPEAIFSVGVTMGVLGMLIGGMIGASQWMYLRWRMRDANWWIPATSLGWGIGLPFALWINLLAGLGLSAFLYGVVIGGAVGLGQWVLLKRSTSPAGKWILISVVALPIGIALTGLIDQRLILWSGIESEQARWFTAFSGGVAGLVVGLLTGMTLLVLLARRRGNT